MNLPAYAGDTDPLHSPDARMEGTLMPKVRMVRLPSLTPREAAALKTVLYELVVRDPIANRALTKVLDALVPKTPTAPLAPEGLPS